MSTGLYILCLVVLCIVGLLYCFRGNKYLKVFMAIYGFYLGFMAVTTFANTAGLTPLWFWALAIGLGIVFALLAFFFLKFAIFLVGGLFGFTIYQVIVQLNPGIFAAAGGAMPFIIGAIFFIIFGAITVALRRGLIIIGTAFYGAYTFMDSLFLLIAALSASSSGTIRLPSLTSGLSANLMPVTITWIIVVVLAIIGMIVQFRSPKRAAGRRVRRR